MTPQGPTPAREFFASLLIWVFAIVAGRLWWRNLKRGTIYFHAWFARESEPFNYWFSMVALAATVGLLAFGGGWFLLDALNGH